MKKKLLLIMIIILGINFCSCELLTEKKNSDKPSNDLIEDEIMDKGPQKGGQISLFSTKPDTLNPLVTNNVYIQEYMDFVFESLIKIDKSQKAIGELAESWEYSQDGTILTFQLKENIFWQDGTPLTSDDVIYTFELIKNPQIQTIYKTNLDNVASFIAVDKRNLKVVLNKPNSLNVNLFTFPILPRHYYQIVDIQNPEAKCNQSLIGSGPYTFESYDKNTSLNLKANGSWWRSKRKDSSLTYPLISSIVIKLYNATSDSVDAFLRKEIDVTPVDVRESSKYSIRLDTILKRFPGRNFDYLSFNMSRAEFGDKNLRQAIGLALDREKLNEEAIPGEGVVVDLPIMPAIYLAEGEMKLIKSDILNAKKLLDDSGWVEKDGLRTKRVNYRYINSFDLVVNNDNKRRIKIAEKIKAQLKQVGLEINVIPKTWDEIVNLNKTRNYQLLLTGIKIPSVPDISYMFSNSPFNYSFYSNKIVDDGLNSLKSELDATKQKRIFTDTCNVILEDSPILGICCYNNAMLFSKKVRGNINPYAWDRYNNISEWYIIQN